MGLTVKTTNPNSPWAYVWEGLLSEEYLRLRFGVLVFGRAYFRNFTKEQTDPDVNANFGHPKKLLLTAKTMATFSNNYCACWMKSSIIPRIIKAEAMLSTEARSLNRI